MAMFWSKKPKAEKTYDNKSPKNATGKNAKGEKASKAIAKVATKPAKSGGVKQDKAAKSPKIVTVSGSNSTFASSILRPRITEKSGVLSQMGVYTFEVTKNSSKKDVSRAIATLYKVTPVKVSVINTPSKNVFVRGRKGVVPGIKKAIVTVKKGEKIDFV